MSSHSMCVCIGAARILDLLTVLLFALGRGTRACFQSTIVACHLHLYTWHHDDDILQHAYR